MGELIPNITTKFILSAALIVIITIAAGALFSNSFLPWIKGFITEWNPFRPAEGWELTITSQTDFTEPIPNWVIDKYLEETFEELNERNILNTVGQGSSCYNEPYPLRTNVNKIEEGKDLTALWKEYKENVDTTKPCTSSCSLNWKLLNQNEQDREKLKEYLFLWGFCKNHNNLGNLQFSKLSDISVQPNLIHFRNMIIHKKVFEVGSDYIKNILISQGTDAYKIIYPSFSGTYEKVYSEFIQSSSSGTQFYCPLWSNGEKSSTGGICEGSRVKSNPIKLVAQGGLKNDNELFMFWTDDEGDPLCKEDKEDKSISPRSSCTIKMNGNKKIFVKAAPLGLLERFS